MSTDPRIEAAAKAIADLWTDENEYGTNEEMATAAIGAADKAATITTVEELDALGFEAVVLDPCGTPAVCQRSAPGFNEWALGGSGELIDSETLLLSGSSCTVLHRGQSDAPDKWIDINGMRGVVCGACGDPTESEPCAEHQPNAYKRCTE